MSMIYCDNCCKHIDTDFYHVECSEDGEHYEL